MAQFIYSNGNAKFWFIKTYMIYRIQVHTTVGHLNKKLKILVFTSLKELQISLTTFTRIKRLIIILAVFAELF